MVDKKKDCLINKRSGCPEQLSTKNLCLENAKTRNQLGAPKGVDEHPPERFPFLPAFAENLIHYFRKFKLNTANSYINIIDKLETQLADMDFLGENELKSYVLSETNSDILPNANGEKENDVQLYVRNTGNNRIYFNKERKEEPFIEDACFPEEYTESLAWKTAIMRLETYCDRLQILMKGHFETKSMHFSLDSKGSNSKPLPEQQLKQVLEKMLHDKNFMEVLLLLMSSCEIDALMNYLNKQVVPSTNRRCLGGDTNGSPSGIPCFLIKLYRELLRGRPSIVLKINHLKASSLKDLIVIDEIQDIFSIDSTQIFQNVKERLKKRPKDMEHHAGINVDKKRKYKLKEIKKTLKTLPEEREDPVGFIVARKRKYILEEIIQTLKRQLKEMEDKAGFSVDRKSMYILEEIQETLKRLPKEKTDIAGFSVDRNSTQIIKGTLKRQLKEMECLDSKCTSIFQKVEETLKSGPKETEDKEGLVKLFAGFLTVLVEPTEIEEVMQRTEMTPCMREEASPPTAFSDSSSLSQSESLSSLEWEDPPTDTLRQLLDTAMGREPLPPDTSVSFIIQVPIIDLMAKSDEEPERDLSQTVASSLNGSETKENNLTETLSPAKEDENYQTLEKNINLVQIVINQLTLKQFF
ncbi:uncharacterized protein LOC106161467 [Lingula anatina]|uniref:Uncharacterized protein LOC106161467 n=1 Tax=Lingula anatina TaxID=7574 RepID=A0A1S3I6J9_LINAN|nr:uncharacterized protein LOC106161467 [Lingula anatina]XP_013393888.1 uncharacterized protein LOC106161467 [Lingula anatina]|eukprot:XP_013393882.1 uncharacterized protein LOC106161467 [Lingula anatina]